MRAIVFWYNSTAVVKKTDVKISGKQRAYSMDYCLSVPQNKTAQATTNLICLVQISHNF